MKKKKIYNKLKKIEGYNLTYIGRTANMIYLEFGGKVKKVCKGKVRIYPEYTLHIQCPWRIRENAKIILGSDDIYRPFCLDVPDDWDYEIYNRRDEESSVFDVAVKKINKGLKNVLVEKISLDDVNNLYIKLSNEWEVDTFIVSSCKDEYWRLINFKKDEHIVVYDEV